jgi:hypothetical protein
MSADVVRRLIAVLDEIERLAGLASPGPWRPNAEHDEVLAGDDETVCDGFALSNNQLRNTVDHIVLNADPESVLRLCRAHRDIIERYQKAAAKPDELMAQRAHGVDVLIATGAANALLDIVRDLARGLGVEETEGNQPAAPPPAVD